MGLRWRGGKRERSLAFIIALTELGKARGNPGIKGGGYRDLRAQFCTCMFDLPVRQLHSHIGAQGK